MRTHMVEGYGPIGYTHENGAYWCANCQYRLRVDDTADDGSDGVIEHETLSDCEWERRKGELVNRFLWSAFRR